MIHGPFRHLAAAALVAAAAVAVPVAPAPAQSQDFVAQANAFYASIPQDKRSDLVILPAVAKMDDPPAQIALDKLDFGSILRPILYPTTAPGWPAVEAWLMAQPQRDALAALAKVTDDEGPTTRMVFAQPYGVEGATPEMVGAELYTELGDPPTLAAAEFKYFDGIEKLLVLAHAEANRLLAEGKGAEALEVMLDWLFFSRQIADRQLLAEKTAGMVMTYMALLHLRDLAYQDFQAESRSLSPSALVGVIKRLDDRRGPLGIERLTLPRADRLAVDQLLHRVYDTTTKKPNDLYGSTLARVTAGDRPLRLFSEAAKWDMVKFAAGGWYDVQDALKNVANDFQKRWDLRAGDPMLQLPTDYERLIQNKPGMAVIDARYKTYPVLFRLRDWLRTEAAGTRTGLAMYAFYLQNRQFPRDITAVRPTFIRDVDKDPYGNGATDLVFFVPVRDQPKGPRGETPPPHEVRVFPGMGYPNFAITLRDDQFVIYSVGPDGNKEWAKNATQGQPDYQEGDYLLWPPVPSLLRRHLMQQNQFN